MIKALRKNSDMFFDVHLMITEPEKYVGEFCDSGADMVTFHPEASKDPLKALDIIKSKGKHCGVVLNADQPFIFDLFHLSCHFKTVSHETLSAKACLNGHDEHHVNLVKKGETNQR